LLQRWWRQDNRWGIIQHLFYARAQRIRSQVEPLRLTDSVKEGALVIDHAATCLAAAQVSLYD
jgi:hypothetical protein